MNTGNSGCEGAERTYRLMLRFYPPAFRRHFGVEMLQVFWESYSRQ